MIGLDTVVGVLLGVVPWCRLQLLQPDRIRRRWIGDHLNRCHLGGVDGPVEEPAGRLGIPVWRYQDVDDLAELVDRAVDVTPLASDLHLRLVHLPAVPDGVATRSSGVGQQRREPLHPPVDGDVIDFDASLSEEFLDVAVGQAEAQVPAGGNDDHVGREAEAGEGGAGGGSGRWRRVLMPAVSLLERGHSERNSAEQRA
jgi:hypothetical protein